MISLKKILALAICFGIIYTGFNVAAVSVSAKSAVVLCADTGEVIFSKNADTRMPMASTTKIMTALLLCEYGNLEKEIVVTPEMVAVEGSSMGLLAGDTVSLRSLLYGMMLPSGNDAANTTAITVGGSIEKFVDMMNERAEDLGLKDTHFETPSGLDGENHYTTAKELALLAREALKNENFKTAVSSRYETLYYGNPPYRRTLKNHNRLLDSFEGATGVKTGFTKKSGRCLVSSAERDGRSVIAVTLNAPDDWNDHKLLLEYGLSNVKSFTPNIDFQTELRVINGVKERVKLTYNAPLISVCDDSKIEYKTDISENIRAPFEEGTRVGSLCFICDGRVIDSVSVYTAEGVDEKEMPKLRFSDIFKNILSNF